MLETILSIIKLQQRLLEYHINTWDPQQKEIKEAIEQYIREIEVSLEQYSDY